MTNPCGVFLSVLALAAISSAILVQSKLYYIGYSNGESRWEHMEGLITLSMSENAKPSECVECSHYKHQIDHICTYRLMHTYMYTRTERETRQFHINAYRPPPAPY